MPTTLVTAYARITQGTKERASRHASDIRDDCSGADSVRPHLPMTVAPPLAARFLPLADCAAFVSGAVVGLLATGRMSATLLALLTGWMVAALAALNRQATASLGRASLLCLTALFIAAAPSTPPSQARPGSDAVICILDILEGHRPVHTQGRVQARTIACRDPVFAGEWQGVRMPVTLAGAVTRDALLAGDRIHVRLRWLQSRPGIHEHTPVWESGALAVADSPILRLAPRFNWRRPIDRFRQRAESAMYANLSGQPRSVLLAMVVGTRTDLSAEVRQQFGATGVAHVIAVSGMHLVLLAQLASLALERLARRSVAVVSRFGAQRATAALLLPMTLAYVILTGAPASAVRAGLMLGVVLVATLLRRRSGSMQAFALAVMLMVAWSPDVVTDMGFQLSAAATLSLVLQSMAPDGTTDQWHSAWLRPLSWLYDSIRVSVVASSGTAGILIFHFGLIPPLSPLANLIIVPPLAAVAFPVCAVLAGLHGVGISAVVPGLVWQVPEQAARLALWVCDEAAWLLATPAVTGQLGLLWCTVICLVGLLLCVGRWWWLSIALQCLPLMGFDWQHRGLMSVRAIPVGQGDCTLVQAPNGETWLIDAGGGGRDPTAVGLRHVVPWLRREGFATIDHLVLSHGDADHAAGMLELIEALSPRSLVVSSGSADERWIQRAVERAQRHGVTVRTIATPLVERSGGLRIDWWPGVAGMSDNDAGLVARFCLGDVCALLTGDAEAEREAALLRLPLTRLRSVYLKVGHHGSSTSTTEPFIDAVRPQAAVIHAGDDNRFGFPHAPVMHRLQQRGVSTCLTSRGRSCTFITDGHRWWNDAHWARRSPGTLLLEDPSGVVAADAPEGHRAEGVDAHTDDNAELEQPAQALTADGQ